MSSLRKIEFAYRLRRGDFLLDAAADIPLRGITGVFGASGAGKTSLLRCIAGLEKPGRGKLLVDGDAWQDSDTGEWREVHERRVGYVFQEPSLFSHLDVRGNIDYGLRRRDHAHAVDRDHVIELLGLESLLDRKPADLSGGEAQRVAIARALLSSPRFMLMDEPLASLDQRRRSEILPYFDRLHGEAAVPIVYVSHNIDEICHLCDHLLVMDGGRIVAGGDLRSVLVGLDAPVLSGDEAGAIIEGTTGGYDSTDDLTTMRYSGGALLVPGKVGNVDGPARLRIRASDVSLCLELPQSTTILNIVPVTVEAIHEDESPSVLIRLVAGSDRLLARVTRRSCRQLGLEAGARVYAQIKSVAVRRAW